MRKAIPEATSLCGNAVGVKHKHDAEGGHCCISALQYCTLLIIRLYSYKFQSFNKIVTEAAALL